jgi:hypothetical protein
MAFFTRLVYGSLAIVIASAVSHAAEPDPVIRYYIGESITTMGSTVARHPYIVARTTDERAKTIAETVVSYQQSGFKENSSVMTIDGNRFAMTVSTGTVTGSGELTGVPWHWTFLRAEFKVASSGMRIVDYNFFADHTDIMGHKDFYLKKDGSDERLLMQEDVVLHVVERATFDAKRAELLKQ